MYVANRSHHTVYLNNPISCIIFIIRIFRNDFEFDMFPLQIGSRLISSTKDFDDLAIGKSYELLVNIRSICARQRSVGIEKGDIFQLVHCYKLMNLVLINRSATGNRVELSFSLSSPWYISKDKLQFDQREGTKSLPTGLGSRAGEIYTFDYSE